MNRYKWIVFFVIISSSLSAQEISNDSLLNLLRDKKISFSKYIRIDSLENQFLKANLKDSYIQTISVFHSFYGNYKKSIDKMSERGFMSSSVSLDSNVFNKYTPYAASILMDSIAKNNRIVIFNESHHTPIHRVVTSSFLETFYNQGFRYLAVEGLSIKDSLINQRKFPVKNLTGYYINEPTYGDLVRNALKIGFTLISYDFNSLDIKEREKGQANNLMDKVFKPFPDAKLLIHCGFSHGLDLPPDPYSGVAMMGFYLRMATGIDPFVINQQQLTENTSELFERNDYVYANRKYDIKYPTMFLNENKKIWKFYDSNGDAALFLPRSQYLHGRPTWLTNNGKKKYYFPNINLHKVDYPFALQAMLAEENENAVPVDQVMYEKPDEDKALLLYPGDYILIYTNAKDSIIKTEKISIK